MGCEAKAVKATTPGGKPRRIAKNAKKDKRTKAQDGERKMNSTRR